MGAFAKTMHRKRHADSTQPFVVIEGQQGADDTKRFLKLLVEDGDDVRIGPGDTLHDVYVSDVTTGSAMFSKPVSAGIIPPRSMAIFMARWLSANVTELKSPS